MSSTTKVRVLRSSVWVPRPPADVFPFFAEPQNLESITPDWLRFRIVTPLPIAMREGAVIDYALRVRGLPVRWRTRITRYEPPVLFADEQVRGPYPHWLHVHEFEARDGGTEIRDRVELVPPGGPLRSLLFRRLVRPDLLRIFRHRLDVITRNFGGGGTDGRVWFEEAG